jgi:hypothetical protein
MFSQQWYMSYRFVDSFRAAVSCQNNCEISASSWFYYKEICYNAWSHERKKLHNHPINSPYTAYLLSHREKNSNLAPSHTATFTEKKKNTKLHSV